MNTQEENVNPYVDLTDDDLSERILEIRNELREAWENLQEAQASYKNAVGGNVQRTYVYNRPIGSINYGRIRL